MKEIFESLLRRLLENAGGAESPTVAQEASSSLDGNVVWLRSREASLVPVVEIEALTLRIEVLSQCMPVARKSIAELAERSCLLVQNAVAEAARNEDADRLSAIARTLRTLDEGMRRHLRVFDKLVFELNEASRSMIALTTKEIDAADEKTLDRMRTALKETLEEVEAIRTCSQDNSARMKSLHAMLVSEASRLRSAEDCANGGDPSTE